MRELLNQIMKFGIVGLLATMIDYGVMIFLTEFCNIYYLFSSFLSFVISVLFNYFCSMKYVFKGKEGMSKRREFVIFIVLSIIGLGINQIGMWFMVDFMSVYYMISKLFVTGIVMIWNFVSRKILLEE